MCTVSLWFSPKYRRFWAKIPHPEIKISHLPSPWVIWNPVIPCFFPANTVIPCLKKPYPGYRKTVRPPLYSCSCSDSQYTGFELDFCVAFALIPCNLHEKISSKWNRKMAVRQAILAHFSILTYFIGINEEFLTRVQWQKNTHRKWRSKEFSKMNVEITEII